MELSELFVFTNGELQIDAVYDDEWFLFAAHCFLSESIQVITSCHLSLQDLKYFNGVSSALIDSLWLTHNTEKHIYQELTRVDHRIITSSTDLVNDVHENKESCLPLMPIKYHSSRIPVRTLLSDNKNKNISNLTQPSEKFELEIKKTSKMVKPS